MIKVLTHPHFAGFMLKLSNGTEIGVYMGPGNHRSGRGEPCPVDDEGNFTNKNAEIAIYREGSDVPSVQEGWQDADKVAAIIAEELKKSQEEKQSANN